MSERLQSIVIEVNIETNKGEYLLTFTLQGDESADDLAERVRRVIAEVIS